MRILGLPAPLALGAALALPLLSQPARWEEAIPHDRLLSEQVLALAVDTNDVTWIGTSKGVTRWQSAQSTHFTTWDALPASEIRDIAVDARNVKWFATRSGVASFDDREWRTLDTALGLVSNDVTSIAVDFENVKWFGTKGGLSRFDGSTWTSFTLQSGDLPSDSVNQVAVGHDGNVWVATDGGVAHYDGADWQIHSRRDGLASDHVTSIAVDRHGLVWCGTAEGLSVFDGTNWYGFVEEGREPLGGRERFPRLEFVAAVFIDPANEAWIVTRVNCGEYSGAALRLFHYDHEALRVRYRAACTWDHLAASLAVDESGSLLIGLSGDPSHSGVFRSRLTVDQAAEPVRFEMEEHWFWPTPGPSDPLSRRVIIDDISETVSGGLTLKRRANGGSLLRVGGKLLISTDTRGDVLWEKTLGAGRVLGYRGRTWRLLYCSGSGTGTGLETLSIGPHRGVVVGARTPGSSLDRGSTFVAALHRGIGLPWEGEVPLRRFHKGRERVLQLVGELAGHPERLRLRWNRCFRRRRQGHPILVQSSKSELPHWPRSALRARW